VIPNRKGNDLYTKNDSYDAHTRLEDPGNGAEEIVIAIFNSKIKMRPKPIFGARIFQQAPKHDSDLVFRSLLYSIPLNQL
jgi:hypothetical protein